MTKLNSLRTSLLVPAASLLLLASCAQMLEPTDELDELPADALADDRLLKEVGDLGPAPVHIEPVRPHSRTQVVLTVDEENGAQADLSVSGLGCGSLDGLDGQSVDLPFFGDALVGDGGSCSVSATILYEDGSRLTRNGSFTVQSREPQLLPMEVPGSVYVPNLPPPSVDLGPTVTAVTGPGSFINGQTQTWTVDHDSEVGARAVLVWLDGYPGYYRFNLGGVSGPFELPLLFPADAFD